MMAKTIFAVLLKTGCASLLCLALAFSRGALSLRLLPSACFAPPSEPQNWLTYSGSYMSQRYSPLQQINSANVKNLELKWVFQAQSLQKFETTPLVVDGIMYLTQSPNDLMALDAKTGRVFWVYHYAYVSRRAPLLRNRESRRGYPRQHAIHGYGRRASDRRGRQERTPHLE